MDPVENVMKKCTLCVDRIYSETLPEEDRIPGLRAHLPLERAAFRRFQRSSVRRVSRLVAERGGIDLMPEMGTRPVNKYLPPRPKTHARPVAPSAPPRRPRPEG
jgi:Fe-S-cluster-containing dehydrogenase component